MGVGSDHPAIFSFSGTKLIYRHYATLFFIFVVDATESELGILDLIQTFVETLDVCFRNVCELDMIFNMDRVHYILDEIVQGGMVRGWFFFLCIFPPDRRLTFTVPHRLLRRERMRF